MKVPDVSPASPPLPPTHPTPCLGVPLCIYFPIRASVSYGRIIRSRIIPAFFLGNVFLQNPLLSLPLDICMLPFLHCDPVLRGAPFRLVPLPLGPRPAIEVSRGQILVLSWPLS